MRSLTWAAAMVIAVATCTNRSAARADEALSVSGTGAALGTLHQLAVLFEAAHPGRRLRVLPSVGSSGALQAVAQGALDIGISGRDLQPEERKLGLVALPYARTPLLLAVGPRTGATAITGGELARILRGEVERWPGGERVRLVMRPALDADTQSLRAVSPELSSAVDRALSREGVLLAVTNQECNAMLARTPGAIGLSSLTQLLSEGTRVSALSWNGVAPTLANLRSGAYPLVRTLYVVTRTSPSPPVRRFLTFLGSPAARAVLTRTGNLPVPLEPSE